MGDDVTIRLACEIKADAHGGAAPRLRQKTPSRAPGSGAAMDAQRSRRARTRLTWFGQSPAKAVLWCFHNLAAVHRVPGLEPRSKVVGTASGTALRRCRGARYGRAARGAEEARTRQGAGTTADTPRAHGQGPAAELGRGRPLAADECVFAGTPGWSPGASTGAGAHRGGRPSSRSGLLLDESDYRTARLWGLSDSRRFSRAGSSTFAAPRQWIKSSAHAVAAAGGCRSASSRRSTFWGVGRWSHGGAVGVLPVGSR